MPQSQEYEPYEISSLAGGLARHLGWKKIPPGYWLSGRGFLVEKEALVIAQGYTPYTIDILSPEYQEFYSSGAVHAIVYVDPPGVTGFSIHTLTDPDAVIRTVGQWQVKLESDDDGHYATIGSTIEDPGNERMVILCSGLYSGTLFMDGSATDVFDDANKKYRYLCRKTSPLVTEQENCPVVGLRMFRQSPGTNYLYAITPRDIYKYDAINGEFAQNDRLTQVYQVGTADFRAAGPDIVTGVATNWAAPTVDTDMLIKADAHGDSAWTRILSVDGALQLTLMEVYRGNPTGGAVAYTIIRTYLSGGITLREARKYRWSTCSWLSGLPGPRFIACNGNNRPQAHDGAAANMSDLATGGAAGDLDNIQEGGGVDCSSARVCLPYMESLCLGATVENATYYPRRVRWSNPRDCGNGAWSPWKWRDLEGSDEIQGAEILGGTGVWFTTYGIHNQNFQPSPIDFSFQRKVNELGTVAPGTIKKTADGLIVFLGPDDFYTYDLIRPKRFGEPVKDLIFDSYNDDFASMAESFYDDITGMYLTSFPSVTGGNHWNWKTVGFDSVKKRWLEPTDGHMCFGRFYETEELPVINAYEGLIDSYDRLFDERAEVEAPVLLAGGRHGQVMRLFVNGDYDYADPAASITLGMTDLGRRGLKRLGWLTFSHDEDDFSIDVYVALSLDGRRVKEWVGPLAYSLASVPNEDRKRILTVDRCAHWFAFRIDSLKRNQFPVLEDLAAHFRMEPIR